MTWSTSRLAKIAGTTVKTIRYYHQIGVMPEPERTSNGYKHYQVEHLVALLRILRLKELGLPVHDVGRVISSTGDAWEAVRALDAELEQRIAKWTAVREELAALLSESREVEPLVDLPAGMLGLSHSVNDADRAILLVYSHLFDDDTMESIAESLRGHVKSAEELAFDALPPHADEPTRQQLAEQLAPRFAAATGTATAHELPVPRIAQDAATVENVLGTALSQLYNRAQVDVLQRVSAIVTTR